jgi:hypothetical protein
MANEILPRRRRRDQQLGLERKRKGNDADRVEICSSIVMLMRAALS